MFKKEINAEQRKVLALIESAIPKSGSPDSAMVGKMLDAKA